mmetsp:Transcript_10031/g.31401  ORF Transcript_10031/g.31401 Transcript_10031/m.31401 type:complete len:201 (-) Transcript_10031:721-1323(-)
MQLVVEPVLLVGGHAPVLGVREEVVPELLAVGPPHGPRLVAGTVRVNNKVVLAAVLFGVGRIGAPEAVVRHPRPVGGLGELRDCCVAIGAKVARAVGGPPRHAHVLVLGVKPRVEKGPLVRDALLVGVLLDRPQCLAVVAIKIRIVIIVRTVVGIEPQVARGHVSGGTKPSLYLAVRGAQQLAPLAQRGVDAFSMRRHGK